MKLERKHLLVVGIVLLVAFHMVLLFSPIIPVEESYIDYTAFTETEYDWRLSSGSLSLIDIDGDGNFELTMESGHFPLRTRTVYKSIVELLLGS